MSRRELALCRSYDLEERMVEERRGVRWESCAVAGIGRSGGAFGGAFFTL